MKRYIYLGLLVACVVVVTGCRSQQRVTGSLSDLDGNWNITEMNGKKMNPAETRQFLVFDSAQQSISGNAGCNRISGRIEYNPSQSNIVKFPRIVSTRMACMDMSAEDELMRTLDKIVRFEPAGSTRPVQAITFYGTDNSKLLVIEKQ